MYMVLLFTKRMRLVRSGVRVRRGRGEFSAGRIAVRRTHLHDRPAASGRAGRRGQVPLGRHQGDHGHRRPPHHGHGE